MVRNINKLIPNMHIRKLVMINGFKEDAISNTLMSRKYFEKGLKDLNRTAEGAGTFNYTFI